MLELAQGDFMAAFRWNGGGAWKTKEWSPELPTDTAVTMYSLFLTHFGSLCCTYLVVLWMICSLLIRITILLLFPADM
jgi:hypothetical protein